MISKNLNTELKSVGFKIILIDYFDNLLNYYGADDTSCFLDSQGKPETSCTREREQVFL